MRYLIAMALALFLTSPLLASRCPSLVHQIDEQLAANDYDNTVREQVSALRDQGQSLHDQGKHGDSVKVLEQAMEILNNASK
ncbi:hypothetical protein [Marinobacter zhejiangensis]|uniref:Tetratricopeptide repeat-containing protein n=1 Tax=Marinobacter zhejiangensis TaxID=488535 RepID=A0A1I4Q3S3_9GAMM|nr:hypothetical protein [Marinobacter zhejiangensis]SFM34748.1 hypothetical protein SAMN04487963_2164 [Marinobacter zhejiangensis]